MVIYLLYHNLKGEGIMNYPEFEKVVEVKIADVSYLVFPRRFGGTIVDAMSIVNGALKGKELPMLPAHKVADRSTDVEFINAYHVPIAKTVMKKVPEAITKLYTAPEDETEEDKEIRIRNINSYFEQP
nr:MAG TPA: hypothetical protein [Herelleviridae sp.]